MNIISRFKQWLYKTLKTTNYQPKQYNIYGLFNFRTEAAKNKLWYNGDGNELSQFFKQTYNDNCGFWGATETKGLKIKKVHSGIPRAMVNSITSITCADLNDITINNEKVQEIWDEIQRENNFKNLIKKATKQTLVVGDGAFKICFKDSISKHPIIEFYSGDNVELKRDRGRIKEIIFYTYYTHKGNDYALKEIYGYGYIKYELYRNEHLVPLNTLPELEGYEDIEFSKDTILATTFSFFESDKYEGRGESIFTGKSDAFDSIDETLSNWMDAVRAGRAKTYIPECLIPKNPENGAIMRPNAFDNQFIATESDMAEGASNHIQTEQPDIRTEAFLNTYTTFLDIALQGVISPSTLGIDTKKLDNAEAQREKEKTTLYTRQAIIYSMTEELTKLVQAAITMDAMQNGYTAPDYTITVQFGEYASPSFEAVCETLNKARPGHTLMSIEAQVEEMWGDSRTDEWKNEEVQRLKAEQGLAVLDEPQLII